MALKLNQYLSFSLTQKSRTQLGQKCWTLEMGDITNRKCYILICMLSVLKEKPGAGFAMNVKMYRKKIKSAKLVYSCVCIHAMAVLGHLSILFLWGHPVLMGI